MKRFVIVFIIALLIPLSVSAQDSFSEEEYNSYLSSYELSFFEKELDRDTYAFLEELGISDFNYESITSLSLDDALNIIVKTISQQSKTPFRGVLSVIIYILLSAMFRTFKTERGEMNELYSTVSALIISAVLIIKISPTVSLSCAALGTAGDFVYAFVPVFCTIIAASGGLTTSLATNTTLLAMAQGLSLLSSNVFMPVINCFLGIGICSGLRAELGLNRLIDGMKKVLTSVISFVSAVFVSVLSIKTTVASKADILGIRSARFVINSVVPVVGGTISEGLLSIQSYSSLIKSSVGIVGIIAVALVFLPALLEAVIWRLLISLCLIISDIFDDRSVSLVLKSFGDAMLLVNVVLVISMMSTVVSIGLLVVANGS